MFLRSVLGGLACLLAASTSFGLETSGTLKSIDMEKGIIVVFAGGQDRTLQTDKSLKILDPQGKELTAGLKSPELKPGAQVRIIVDRNGSALLLKEIQLRPADATPPRQQPNANEPERTSVGLKPLTELTASDTYKQEAGGLYGEGKNEPPPQHEAAAKEAIAKIEMLDAEGKPSSDGKIVLVSISMSNATQEFSVFKRIADSDPQKSPRLSIVDCAQGGQAMAQWARPDARPWDEALRRLASADVSPNQVQIAWVKLANVSPSGELSQHGQKLYDDTLAVLQIAKSKFPNLRVAYLGSRIYAGYARSKLNPEPYAYEGAFVVRWLLRDQMKGEAVLNFDAARGPVKAPLLLWGPYLWADGMTPRKSDGLIWQRSDLGPDGTHPSDAGRQKVANILLSFFKTDPLAKTWFVRP